jgi:hypothetical protein
MAIIKTSLFAMLIIGLIILVLVSIQSFTHEKIVVYGCSPEFWENNLELWENLGVDYNDDFDETFGKDYFDPDITLQQAISKEGVGMNRLASSGTAAYLNALVDPEIDETVVKQAVHFGYIHEIDQLNEQCERQNSSST